MDRERLKKLAKSNPPPDSWFEEDFDMRYHTLKVGDRLQEGDEHRHKNSQGWHSISKAVGKTIKDTEVKYRRPVK